MSNYSTPIYTSMSNTIKATIAIVSLIIIATAGVFILGKKRGEEASKPAVQSSSSVQSFIKSNQSNSNISNSQQINSKVAENKSISTLASQNQFASYTLPKSETVDGVKVTYLDSNNPPQYIKDYLACETKDKAKFSGFFVVKDSEISYNCAPEDENTFLCAEGVIFRTININGWECYPRNTGLPMECDIAMSNIISNSDTPATFKNKYIKAKSVFEIPKEYPEKCLVFTNVKLSIDELKSIANYNSNFKIINYFN